LPDYSHQHYLKSGEISETKDMEVRELKGRAVVCPAFLSFQVMTILS
jgi:hypothetical protein